MGDIFSHFYTVVSYGLLTNSSIMAINFVLRQQVFVILALLKKLQLTIPTYASASSPKQYS